MEIKEERNGSKCNQCGSKETVWSMNLKKEICSKCVSHDIVPVIKRWVAVDELIKEIDVLVDRIICIPNYSDGETHIQYAYRYAKFMREMLKKKFNSPSNEKADKLAIQNESNRRSMNKNV